MILGQFIFMGVIIAIHGEDQGETFGNMKTLDTLAYIIAGLVLVCIPIGYYIRMQLYKRNWQGDIITPKGYFTGNLILLALCEGPALMGLVLVMLAGEFWPWIIPTLVAMGAQIINFPNGRPMYAPHNGNKSE